MLRPWQIVALVLIVLSLILAITDRQILQPMYLLVLALVVMYGTNTKFPWGWCPTIASGEGVGGGRINRVMDRSVGETTHRADAGCDWTIPVAHYELLMRGARPRTSPHCALSLEVPAVCREFNLCGNGCRGAWTWRRHHQRTAWRRDWDAEEAVPMPGRYNVSNLDTKIEW